MIGQSGEQLGIFSLPDALSEAEKASLDLVQMAKDGDPLVCRLLNHGKHIFDAKKKKGASKKKQKRTQLKEIKSKVTEERTIKSFIPFSCHLKDK